MRLTEEEFAKISARNPQRQIHMQNISKTIPAPAAPTKYRSQRIVVDGKKFDSKLEARYYKLLKLEWNAVPRTVLWFLRQAPFELPGGIRYRLDFLVVRPSKSIDAQIVELVDCKGVLTDVSRNKIRQAESIYGVKIILATESHVSGISV